MSSDKVGNWFALGRLDVRIYSRRRKMCGIRYFIALFAFATCTSAASSRKGFGSKLWVSKSEKMLKTTQGATAQNQRLDISAVTRSRNDLREVIIDIRGGSSRRDVKNSRKHGRKTASLFSSSTQGKKIGKRKVGSSGKQSAEKESDKPGALADTVGKYKSILPLTRIYITMVAVCTILSIALGDEMSQTLLALDPIRTLYGWELWRPITAAAFLGPPSVGWLMSAYYLFEYGSNLERSYGTAQHVVFLLCQVTFLTFTSLILGMPFFGPSIITAMLHVLSRTMPKQKVKWLVFTVPYWTLPIGLMATDVLQAQGSPMAALPHVIGILSGHFYFFHKFVWPKIGGQDWLVAPDCLRRNLDPDARDSTLRDETKRGVVASRRRGKGRKLGRA